MLASALTARVFQLIFDEITAKRRDAPSGPNTPKHSTNEPALQRSSLELPTLIRVTRTE